jgi:hypothetical protein
MAIGDGTRIKRGGQRVIPSPIQDPQDPDSCHPRRMSNDPGDEQVLPKDEHH